MLRTFADGALFGSVRGEGGIEILALHGWARTHRDFDAVFAGGAGEPPLPASLALDLPGFGVSPPPPSAWGSAEYARCVASVLDELATPVVVLGHSFGGRVAVQLAAAHPDAVRALVLTGVPLVRTASRRSPFAYRALRRLRRLGLVGDARLERARQRYGSADYRAAEGVMRDVLVATVNERYDDQLAGLSCPVQLVWGDDDTEAPLAGAERARDLLAHAELTVCPGAGHLTPVTVPDALRRALAASLAGHGGR